MKIKILSLFIVVFLLTLFLSGCFDEKNNHKNSGSMVIITTSVKDFALKLSDLPDDYEIIDEDSNLSGSEVYDVNDRYILEYRNSTRHMITLQLFKYNSTEAAKTHFDIIVGLSKLAYNASIVEDYPDIVTDELIVLDGQSGSIVGIGYKWDRQIISCFRNYNVNVMTQYLYNSSAGSTFAYQLSNDYVQIMNDRI